MDERNEERDDARKDDEEEEKKYKSISIKFFAHALP